MNLSNNILTASKRDTGVLNSIELCKVMNTQQITALHFPFKSGLRKCQERMKVLTEKKLIKKIRVSLDSSNIYFITRPLFLDHSLGVSWSYIWVNKTLKQNEKIITWELEQLKEFGAILQCDALCSIENNITKEVRWYCIEFDRASVNKSRFDKIEKYNTLYEKYGFASSQLMKRLGNPTRFPRVIIITDNAKRALNIREIIQREKQEDGVKFEIHLLSEIIKEATQCILSH